MRLWPGNLMRHMLLQSVLNMTLALLLLHVLNLGPHIYISINMYCDKYSPHPCLSLVKMKLLFEPMPLLPKVYTEAHVVLLLYYICSMNILRHACIHSYSSQSL